MTFRRLDVEQRRRLIGSWQVEILAQFDLGRGVAESEGLSFAELEECKKLLVLHYVEHGQWNWSTASAAFRQGRGHAASRGAIGFNVSPECDEPVPSWRAAPAARVGRQLS